VLVCLTPARPANLEIQAGAVLAERLRGSLMVAHVKVAAESEPHARPSDDLVFATNASLATAVGAAVVTVEAPDVAEALIALAEREHVTHVLFGYSGDPAKALAPESIIGRFVRGARGIEISIVSQPPAKNS
jgi:K+-sensing histidine kinase KdpD